MTTPNPLTLEEVNTIRQRVLAGEDVPLEVLNNCITFLRQSRAAAPKATKEKKASTSKMTEEAKAKLMSALEGL